ACRISGDPEPKMTLQWLGFAGPSTLVTFTMGTSGAGGAQPPANPSVPDGQPVVPPNGKPAPVIKASYQPDADNRVAQVPGRAGRAVANFRRTLRFWAIPAGEMTHELDLPQSVSPNKFATSPGGRYVALMDHNSIHVADSQS